MTSDTSSHPSDRHPSEKQWARALVERGDEPSFRLLYRRYTPRIYGFALRLLGNEAEAEDVVQETWVRAVRKLAGFRWESQLGTWLVGIAHNLCREHLRRRPREEADSLDAVKETSAGERVSGNLRVDLGRALAHLPRGYRTVLMLHDLEGMTHQEIGQRLGIAAGTSKSQLFEARKRMRTWLKGAQHAAP